MNIRDIDLNLLVVFEALITHRNVSRAAKAVGLSQPAMSNALGRLRRTLEDPILVRAAGKMVVTPRATELAEPVQGALRLIRDSLGAGPRFDPKTSIKTFSIEMTDYAVFHLAPDLCRRISRESPGSRLDIRPLETTLPAVRLAEGEIDLVVGHFEQDAGNLYRQGLFDDDFVCLLRKRHPMLDDTLTLEKFVALDHIMVAPWKEVSGLVDEALTSRGFSRRVLHRVPHFLTAPFIVARTDYAITLPRSLANSFAELLPVRAVDLPFALAPLRIAQVWHERAHRDPAQIWLREKLAEVVRSR
jgi:DNA-binding transcriptional LysR family regulator